MSSTALRTTRPVVRVRTIDDIAAIEQRPYDEVVTARTVYDLFRATAQDVGNAMALTILRSEDPRDVGASLTHSDLLREVTRSANMFRAIDPLEPGGSVAFLAPTFPELPALLFGAQVAGVASSINYFLNRDTIIDLLKAQGARTLVTTARHLDDTCWASTEGIFERVPTLRHVVVIGDETEGRAGFVPLSKALMACRTDELDFVNTSDRSTVCALYHTGGTTDRPKLVQLTHGNLIHAAFGFGQVYGYDETDVVINGGPFFHVGGTMTVGLAVLASGAHLIVPSPYALRPKSVIEGYWRIAEAYGVTIVGGVPTSIGAIANSFISDIDTSRIRMAITGGAVLPDAVGERFTERTGIPIYQTYGMTETAGAIAFNPGRGTPVAGSVGFRAPYSETRILRLGSKQAEPCRVGESGLVQSRGPQVFPGYLDPAQNAGTLSEDGWLSTGDVGYLTETGHLMLTGREKDLIVRGGHNIDPAAIEDVANKFDGVDISAAVGMPDQYAGEVPALFVVPTGGAVIDIEQLRQFLDANVHEPPARPRVILTLNELPVTAVGKIFKPKLREMAIAEKVRREVARICGENSFVSAAVSLDEQKRTVVDVLIQDVTDVQRMALADALAPLPQSYRIAVQPTPKRVARA